MNAKRMEKRTLSGRDLVLTFAKPHNDVIALHLSALGLDASQVTRHKALVLEACDSDCLLAASLFVSMAHRFDDEVLRSNEGESGLDAMMRHALGVCANVDKRDTLRTGETLSAIVRYLVAKRIYVAWAASVQKEIILHRMLYNVMLRHPTSGDSIYDMQLLVEIRRVDGRPAEYNRVTYSGIDVTFADVTHVAGREEPDGFDTMFAIPVADGMFDLACEEAGWAVATDRAPSPAALLVKPFLGALSAYHAVHSPSTGKGIHAIKLGGLVTSPANAERAVKRIAGALGTELKALIDVGGGNAPHHVRFEVADDLSLEAHVNAS